MQWKHVCVRAKRGNIYDFPFGRRELAFLNVMVNDISWQKLQLRIHFPKLKPSLLNLCQVHFDTPIHFTSPTVPSREPLLHLLFPKLYQLLKIKFPSFNVLQQSSQLQPKKYLHPIPLTSIIHHVRQQHRQQQRHLCFRWSLVQALPLTFPCISFPILTSNRYTCPTQSPSFFGCCDSNPCTSSGCPPNDLAPASLGISSDPNASTNETTYYPNVSCATGEWWICSAQTPSFQGCCISDPCGGDGSTCPEGNLFPAAFASVSSAAPTSMVTMSPGASGTLQSTAGAATTSIFTSSSTPLPSAASASSKTNIGAIAGGAAGGACLFLIAIVGLSIYLCRRRRQKYTSSSNPINSQTEPDDFSYNSNSPKEMEANGSEFKHGMHFYAILTRERKLTKVDRIHPRPWSKQTRFHGLSTKLRSPSLPIPPAFAGRGYV